jgi:hypothetical protein
LSSGSKRVLNRQEAISLLEEIMTAWESIYSANAVSIDRDKLRDSYKITIYCGCTSETDILETIVGKHGLEMIALNDRKIIQSKV